jgi:hypothetical protein
MVGKRMLLRKALDALNPGGAMMIYGPIIDDDARRMRPVC